jgi:hypothetical protein
VSRKKKPRTKARNIAVRNVPMSGPCHAKRFSGKLSRRRTGRIDPGWGPFDKLRAWAWGFQVGFGVLGKGVAVFQRRRVERFSALVSSCPVWRCHVRVRPGVMFTGRCLASRIELKGAAVTGDASMSACSAFWHWKIGGERGIRTLGGF